MMERSLQIFNRKCSERGRGRTFWQQSLVRLPGAGLKYTTLSTGQTSQKQTSTCTPCSHSAGTQHQSCSPSTEEFPLTGNPGWHWLTPLYPVPASLVLFLLLLWWGKKKKTKTKPTTIKAQDKENSTHRSGDKRQKWVCTSYHCWSPYSNSLLEVRTKNKHFISSLERVRSQKKCCCWHSQSTSIMISFFGCLGA